MKIGEQLRQELGQGDPAFEHAVRQTLDEFETEAKPMMKRKMHIGLSIALVLTLMFGVTAFAVASGRSVLLEKLPGAICTPEAEQLVQQGQNEVCGNEDVRFVVRDAIYDGYGLYLAVNVIPQKDDVVLLEWHGSDGVLQPDSPAARLGIEDADSMTVEQYCAANGLRMIEAHANFCMKNATDWERWWGTNNRSEREPDGSLTIVMSAVFDGDPGQVNIQCVSEEKLKNGYNSWFEEIPLQLTGVGSIIQEEKNCNRAVTVVEETGLRLDSVKATRTPVGCYVDVTWSINAEVPQVTEHRENMWGILSSQQTYICCLGSMDGTKREELHMEQFLNLGGCETSDGRRVHHTVWKMDPDAVLPSEVEIEIIHYFWNDAVRELGIPFDVMAMMSLGVYAFELE